MVNNDTEVSLAPRSHLFMLRIWVEDLGNGQTDWRGKVQYVNSGEVRFFREWHTLESFINTQVINPAPESSEEPANGLND